MATHLLVGNPTAQSGKNKKRIDRALKLFRSAGISADLLPTLPGGGTIEAVRRALDVGPFEVVVAMGGDGTFREVGSALYQSARRDEVALGMLPTGTANDQGKSFGLAATPRALQRNVSVSAEGREPRLDAGRLRRGDARDRVISEELFFDSAGWGLTARALAQRNRDRAFVAELGPLKEVYRDHAVYAGAFLKTFLGSYVVDDKFEVDAILDGAPVHIDGLCDLIVKGTRVYAGAWVFDPTSRHDDGAFELVPFRGKRDWTSKAFVDLGKNPITEAMLNEIGIEHSHPIRASRMELRFRVRPGAVPLSAQIDGEERPASPWNEIEVLRRAIRLIVP